MDSTVLMAAAITNVMQAQSRPSMPASAARERKLMALQCGVTVLNPRSAVQLSAAAPADYQYLALNALTNSLAQARPMDSRAASRTAVVARKGFGGGRGWYGPPLTVRWPW